MSIHAITRNFFRQFLNVTFNEIFCKLALFLFYGTRAEYIASGNSCWLLWPKCWLETEFDCRFELRFSLRINWIIATVRSQHPHARHLSTSFFLCPQGHFVIDYGFEGYRDSQFTRDKKLVLSFGNWPADGSIEDWSFKHRPHHIALNPWTYFYSGFKDLMTNMEVTFHRICCLFTYPI